MGLERKSRPGFNSAEVEARRETLTGLLSLGMKSEDNLELGLEEREREIALVAQAIDEKGGGGCLVYCLLVRGRIGEKHWFEGGKGVGR